MLFNGYKSRIETSSHRSDLSIRSRPVYDNTDSKLWFLNDTYNAILCIHPHKFWKRDGNSKRRKDIFLDGDYE